MTNNTVEARAPSQLARIGLALALVFVALGPAVKYGAIWESRAHPTPNVAVTLPEGTRVTGELSQEWSGLWVLREPDGAEVRFSHFLAMTFPAAQHKPHFPLGGWRSFAPMACIFLIVLVLLTPPLVRLGPRLVSSEKGSANHVA